jgi:folate-dependent tRNA-U54 methylase TrmFO/GidA
MNHNIIPIVNDVLETIIANIERKKTVSFYDFHNTIFIVEPIDDEEYYSNKYDIWWSKEDYSNIHLLYKDELFHFIQDYKKNMDVKLTVKDAIRLLNQP